MPRRDAPAGIDGRQLRALLGAYLRMSARGKAALAFSGGLAGKPRGLGVLLAMYACVGLATASLAATRIDVFTYALLVHTMTFVLVGMSLTAESGDILFNAAETDVLGPRPIAPRTLLAAKALALAGFTLLLALALNLATCLLAPWLPGARPWFPVAHLLAVGLHAAFAAAVVVLAYGLLARFVDRRRLDAAAAWAQVGLAVAFLAASQGLPHLSRRIVGGALAGASPYLLAFPPAWFAAIDVALGTASATGRTVLMASLGAGATAALGWIAVVRLAPAHAEALAGLREARAGTGRTAVRGDGRTARLVGRWLPDPVERAAFRLAAAYIRRDRELRTRLYPSLVSFALFPLLGLLGQSRGKTFWPLLSVSMIGMMPGVGLEALRMSSHHAAAEIFAVAPLAGAGPLFQGVRKAMVWHLLVPGLGLALGIAAVTAPRGLPLALAGLLALPTLSLLPGVFGDYVPLSRPPLRGQQSSTNAVLMLVSTLALAVLLGASWLAWTHGALPLFLAVEVGVVGVCHAALARRIAQRPFALAE